MKAILSAALIVAATVPAFVQEREVPKDSARITVRGCARGRSFTVGERSEGTANLDLAPGRRLRLNGPGKILDEIKKREATVVEVTGLVRKSQLAGPGGVSVAGGRIRIGGALPQDSSATRVGNYNEVVIDLEGWRSLVEPCPSR